MKAPDAPTPSGSRDEASFKDHFSGVAEAYAAARPEYPDALFDALAALVPTDAQVWEPGCGSGQATRGLAQRFARVHASDPSAQQIERHWGRAAPRNITVVVEPGERTTLADASVQLVAVAQALHWFDRARFFAECRRVLAPGGVLAAWAYGDFLVPEGMAGAIAEFRAQIEPHWPPERAQIDARYAGYDWPFPPLPAPELSLQARWTLPRFLGYLASGSASARCIEATGEDPVARHTPALAASWGDAEATRTITWPLFLHLRRKPDPL
ncbi:MAG: class I SAM-dependent methyltransferase [Proteobacteria bacterium]|nr:class I SAM-dependent methyltransferase [Pseudomonadota bacterium]